VCVIPQIRPERESRRVLASVMTQVLSGWADVIRQVQSSISR
jgi:hypothetical protein